MAAELMIWMFRAVLVIGGLWIAGHHHCVANYITKAPHFIKALMLPAVTASGVGMAVCGAVGNVYVGAVFGTSAAVAMSIVSFSVWRSGLYVSRQLARAYDVRRRHKAIINDIVARGTDMADILTMEGEEEARRKGVLS